MFRAFTANLVLIFVVFASVTSSSAQQKRVVQLEINTQSGGADVLSQQKWVEMLSQVGADRVRSKSSRAFKNPEVKETKLGKSTLIQVTGVIQGEKLFLPGGKYSLRDKSKIADYVKKLRDDGATVAMAEKMAFGFTAEQLVAFHDLMGKPIDFSTKGQPSGNVIKKLLTKIPVESVLDTKAKREIASNTVVLEELNGMSVGTALATVVRPLGLVVEPKRKQGKSIQLHLIDTRASKENWPIGWPIQKTPISTEPKLFGRLDLEIRGFALDQVLAALEKRAGVTFLYDQNEMARRGIELSDVKVTIVKKQVSYLGAIDNVLAQVRPQMISEIRVDDKGKPFLWIKLR